MISSRFTLERIAAYGLTRCALQMLRVEPGRPVSLGAAVMSDLSLAFYKGYAELPEGLAFRRQLEREEPEALAAGVHRIAVQSADGSLAVVGDSHDYADTPEPFGKATVDNIILHEMKQVLASPALSVRERWARGLRLGQGSPDADPSAEAYARPHRGGAPAEPAPRRRSVSPRTCSTNWRDEEERAMTRLKAVVLDWAGTMLDFGLRAPMGVFVRAFGAFGIDISISEAREPMGMAKRDHIAHVIRQPRVAALWRQRHGHPPKRGGYRPRRMPAFIPMNVAVVSDFADMIPRAAETVAELRRRGLKIGSTTGYTREIMARLLPLAGSRRAGRAGQPRMCRRSRSRAARAP
jgi:hypothetical protein